jgi:hypothetical protein
MKRKGECNRAESARAGVGDLLTESEKIVAARTAQIYRKTPLALSHTWP